jgi:hypothetical protein
MYVHTYGYLNLWMLLTYDDLPLDDESPLYLCMFKPVDAAITYDNLLLDDESTCVLHCVEL